MELVAVYVQYALERINLNIVMLSIYLGLFVLNYMLLQLEVPMMLLR